MKRHLYRRTIAKTESGKPIRAWYYWYYDPLSHKQVRKTCGSAKEPVLLKRDAEEIIRKLADQDRNYLELKGTAESATIKTIAEAMFKEDSVYMRLKAENNEQIGETTRKNTLSYLNNWIFKKYGSLKPEQIDPVNIQNDLIVADKSNAWRNKIIQIMNSILAESVRNKMLKFKPELKRFKDRSKRKDILSSKEIEKLFPDDFAALARLWDIKGQETEVGFMFGALYALMLSTGLRNGEARAINPEQLIVSQESNPTAEAQKRAPPDTGQEATARAEETARRQDAATITQVKVKPLINQDGTENPVSGHAVYGLIIDRMYNNAGVIVRHLKKGNEEDPNFRVSVLPTKTMEYLRHWISIRPKLVPELLFSFRGRRIGSEHLESRFLRGLTNAGISTEGKVLTPHSLRYTCNTRMRRLIPGESLRMMIGHTSENMTDYYTRLELEEDFIALQKHSPAINQFWGT
jgi:integrase